jgi:hypothetical protein
MQKSLFSLSTLVAIVLLGFLPAASEGCGTGIQGHVYLVSGNQMPSPDEPPPAPKGMQTTLYIHELTNIKQVTRQGQSAFYIAVSTPLVAEVATSDKGYFKTKLKPGWYSLFVKKDGVYYSSIFDDKNNIHPVEVKEGKMTEVTFHANYNAVY